MGISRDQLVDQVRVEMTYPDLYVETVKEIVKDETTGEEREVETEQPVVFTYLFRWPAQREIDRFGRAQALKSAKQRKPQTEVDLDQLCEFILDVETGFDDFPGKNGTAATDTRPMKERAREYFSPPAMSGFVRHAINGLWKAVLPPELFREG